MPVKEPLNEGNDYARCAQNLQGRFCICHQPYDDGEHGDMLQCLVCEDWFHPSCLQLATPDEPDQDRQLDILSDAATGDGEEDDFALICANCIEKYPLLGSLSSAEGRCLGSGLTSSPTTGSLCLPAGWRRTRLCKCERCQDRLQGVGLQFLAQPDRLYEPEPDDILGSSYEGMYARTAGNRH